MCRVLPATGVAAKKMNTKSTKENLFPEVLSVLLKQFPSLRWPEWVERCVVQHNKTPAVWMLSNYGLVSTRSSVTLGDDCLRQQNRSFYGKNYLKHWRLKLPKEFQPLPVNLCSALTIICSKNPFPGLKIMFPLATKAPLDATTLSRWSVLPTVIVSVSVYQPPYLNEVLWAKKTSYPIHT